MTNIGSSGLGIMRGGLSPCQVIRSNTTLLNTWLSIT